MVGEIEARAGDAISHAELVRLVSDLEHLSGARIAEGDRGREQIADDQVGPPIALLGGLVQDLARQVRAVHRLAEGALLAEGHDRALGSQADQ